jgi:hypothetical protein
LGSANSRRGGVGLLGDDRDDANEINQEIRKTLIITSKIIQKTAPSPRLGSASVSSSNTHQQIDTPKPSSSQSSSTKDLAAEEEQLMLKISQLRDSQLRNELQTIYEENLNLRTTRLQLEIKKIEKDLYFYEDTMKKSLFNQESKISHYDSNEITRLETNIQSLQMELSELALEREDLRNSLSEISEKIYSTENENTQFTKEITIYMNGITVLKDQIHEKENYANLTKDRMILESQRKLDDIECQLIDLEKEEKQYEKDWKKDFDDMDKQHAVVLSKLNDTVSYSTLSCCFMSLIICYILFLRVCL